jgi:hypothetical protein
MNDQNSIFSPFKTNTNEKIKEIYEAFCFKMDPIFVLEFDKKKLSQNQTNNLND